MLRIFFLLSAVFLTACGSRPVPPTNQTFIIWYDSETGKEPVLQYAQQENAKILYDYQHFNSLTVRVPVRLTVADTQHAWEQLPGVLSVQPDQVVHLH